MQGRSAYQISDRKARNASAPSDPEAAKEMRQNCLSVCDTLIRNAQILRRA